MSKPEANIDLISTLKGSLLEGFFPAGWDLAKMDACCSHPAEAIAERQPWWHPEFTPLACDTLADFDTFMGHEIALRAEEKAEVAGIVPSSRRNGDHRGDILWYGPGQAPDSLWLGQGSGHFATVPIRIGFQNLTFTATYTGAADVVIVTDVSGSMGDWPSTRWVSAAASTSGASGASTKRPGLWRARTLPAMRWSSCSQRLFSAGSARAGIVFCVNVVELGADKVERADRAVAARRGAGPG